ncbi:hypothetical protein JCM19236_168 [Vibrio sp. JCM 19236]|nr:hypothetical protein JCM19236_168 [Vibrio sp. JCM 19236]
MFVSRSALGHELIELKEKVMLHSLDSQSDPYYLNEEVVDIERKIQMAVGSRDKVFPVYDTSLARLDAYFLEQALALTQTLDRIVGFTIVRNSSLSSLESSGVFEPEIMLDVLGVSPSHELSTSETEKAFTLINTVKKLMDIRKSFIPPYFIQKNRTLLKQQSMALAI